MKHPRQLDFFGGLFQPVTNKTVTNHETKCCGQCSPLMSPGLGDRDLKRDPAVWLQNTSVGGIWQYHGAASLDKRQNKVSCVPCMGTECSLPAPEDPSLLYHQKHFITWLLPRAERSRNAPYQHHFYLAPQKHLPARACPRTRVSGHGEAGPSTGDTCEPGWQLSGAGAG